MQTDARKPAPSWLVPVLVAAVAIPTFGAFWIGGRPQLGALWAAFSVAFGLLLVVGRRSGTVRILSGAEDDERALTLEYRAMTFVALVLVITLAGLFLAAGVRGESGVTYAVLLLLAETTHVVALAVLNRRS